MFDPVVTPDPSGISRRTADNLTEALGELVRLVNLNSDGTIDILNHNGSVTIRVKPEALPPGWIVGKITRINSSTKAHSWAEVAPTGAGAWSLVTNGRSGAAGLSTTGDTHTNTAVDNIPSTTGLIKGQPVSGSGIVAGTTIASITSATAIVLSAAASATASTVALTFAPFQAAYERNLDLATVNKYVLLWPGFLDATAGQEYEFDRPASGADHACRLNGISGTSLSASGGTLTLSWNAEDYDTDAYHDNSTNPTRITIPTGLGGKYVVYFACSAGTDSGVTLGLWPKVDITKNGSIIWTAGPTVYRVGTGVTYYLTGAFEVNLSAADYLEVVLTNQSGSTLTVGTPLMFGVRKSDKAG